MSDPFVEDEAQYTEEHIQEIAWELTQDLEDLLKAEAESEPTVEYPWSFG